MKISPINFGNKPPKTFEEIQNEQLSKLYKQYQNKPFDYATITYYKNKEPKIKIYPKKNLLKTIIIKTMSMII